MVEVARLPGRVLGHLSVMIYEFSVGIGLSCVVVIVLVGNRDISVGLSRLDRVETAIARAVELRTARYGFRV